MVFPLQIFNILFAEVNGLQAIKIYEFSILRPVLVRISIPVECELLDLQHGEGSLLVLLVVDVEEHSFKSVVRRRVHHLINSQSKIECFFSSADAGIFKPEMNVVD